MSVLLFGKSDEFELKITPSRLFLLDSLEERFEVSCSEALQGKLNWSRAFRKNRVCWHRFPGCLQLVRPPDDFSAGLFR